MDHHCPWLNTCVGFKNRKVFILLLIYAFALTCLALAFTLYPTIMFASEIARGNFVHLVNFIICLIGYGLLIAFFFIMIAFLRYHFNLIDKNSTTIEHLDEKRGNIPSASYDMGRDFNWKFVLGQYKACWFVPYDRGIGASMGDGVVMTKQEPSSRGISVVDQGDGEFNYDELQNAHEDKNWNNDIDNDPLNQLGNKITGDVNPLGNPLAYNAYDNRTARNQRGDVFFR